MSRNMVRSAGTDYIALGDVAAARFQELSAWTALVFFRMASLDASNEGTIFSKSNNSSSQRQFWIDINNGTPPQEFEVYINNLKVIDNNVNIIDVDIWYMVALANDGTGGAGGLKLYMATMDGSFDADHNPTTGTHGGDSGTLTSPIWAGARNQAAADYWDGDLAHFAYFGSELSSAKILQYLRHPTRVAVAEGSNCIFYLPLMGGSPEQDLSGNQNNGTVNGTPTVSAMPPVALMMPPVAIMPSIAAAAPAAAQFMTTQRGYW